MTLIISVHEPDGKTRAYVCELIRKQWFGRIVEARIINPFNPDDPFHFKLKGQVVSARQKDCLFLD